MALTEWAFSRMLVLDTSLPRCCIPASIYVPGLIYSVSTLVTSVGTHLSSLDILEIKNAKFYILIK